MLLEQEGRAIGITSRLLVSRKGDNDVAVGYEALVIERTACVSQGDTSCTFEGMYLPK